jgi:Ino eighty subunit 1
LESPTAQNPYSDGYSQNHPGKVPAIRYISQAEMRVANIDTPEEIEWGIMMSNQRNAFLHKLVASINHDKRPKLPPQGFLIFSESVVTTN